MKFVIIQEGAGAVIIEAPTILKAVEKYFNVWSVDNHTTLTIHPVHGEG